MSLKPLVLALIAYVALGVGAWALLAPRASRWAADLGVSGWVGGLGATVLVAVAWVLLFSTLFVVLAGVLGGFFWDKLAAEVEALDGGALMNQGSTGVVALGTGAVVADSVRRLVLAVVVAIAALIGALAVGPLAPILGWVAAGFLGLLDYSAPAALRRGWTLREQMGRVVKRSSLPFAMVVGVVSLLPFVNLLLWPASVAGGTLLVRRLERES